MTFELDTSGVVFSDACILPAPCGLGTISQLRWTDLDPRTQGCITALFDSDDFAEIIEREQAFADDNGEDPAAVEWVKRWTENPKAFRYLAPETLQRIVEDGAAWKAGSPDGLSYVGEADGLVYLREASERWSLPGRAG